MATDKAWLEEQYARMTKRGKTRAFGGKDLWRPKVGPNKVRIIVPQGENRWAWESVWHFGVDTIDHICFEQQGVECPTCTLVDDLYATQDKTLAEAAKAIQKSTKIYMNILDRAEPAKGRQIASVGPKIFQGILALALNPDYDNEGCDITDAVKGRDVTIVRAKENSPDMYQIMPGANSTPLDPDPKKRAALQKSAEVLMLEPSEMSDVLKAVGKLRAKLLGEDMPVDPDEPAEAPPGDNGDGEPQAEDGGEPVAEETPAEETEPQAEEQVEADGSAEDVPADDAENPSFPCVGPVVNDEERGIEQGQCTEVVAEENGMCEACQAHEVAYKAAEAKKLAAAKKTAAAKAAPKPAAAPAKAAPAAAAPKPAATPAKGAAPAKTAAAAPAPVKAATATAPKANPATAKAPTAAPKAGAAATKSVPSKDAAAAPGKAAAAPTSKLPMAGNGGATYQFPPNLPKDLRTCFGRTKEEGGHDPNLDRCMVCEFDTKCMAEIKRVTGPKPAAAAAPKTAPTAAKPALAGKK